MRSGLIFALAGTLVFSTAALPVAAKPATPEATPAQTAAVDATIELGEFFIKPPSAPLIAGQPYHFVVKNTGLVTHELVIEPAGAVDAALEKNGEKAEVEDIAKGQTKELTWTFDKPGDFEFACFVDDHYQHGMLTKFTVLPADTATVGVELRDFTVTAQASELRTGTPYLFQVTNRGKQTHEFIIESAGAVDKPLEGEMNGSSVEAEVEDIAPGETKTLPWVFAKSGDYQLACHVPGHYEMGMKTSIAVTP